MLNTSATGAAPEFAQLIDLASSRMGGQAVVASDDFFAEKENLVKPEVPVFIAGKFTERGKWMDGWESRRKREPGNDWCIVKLGAPGIIRGFNVDTAHFNGNQPEHCTIEAAELVDEPDAKALAGSGVSWTTVLDRTRLEPSREHFVAADGHGRRCTHVRLSIFPDGGVARLRVYGEVVPDWEWLRSFDKLIDLAGAVNGGLVIEANNMHFGSRHNLIMPGRAANMGDGWETRRKRGLTWAGMQPVEYDWCVVRLGRQGTIRAVEVDTNHFKGNFPESCAIECCDVGGAAGVPSEGAWRSLLPRTKLTADRQHVFERELMCAEPSTHARLKIYPDGGVSRLRLHGVPT